MIDLASSLGLFGLLFVCLLGYGLRAMLHGRARYNRIERDGGSAPLGEGAMSAGYGALQPLGRGLAALGLTPNAISLGSLLLGFVAAVALAAGHFGVAAALVAAAALGDALDGIVARLTGVASAAGEVLAATADRYREFFFLGALAVAYRGNAAWLVLVLAALLGSVVTSYVSAKAESLHVEVPRGSMRRPERALYLTLGAALTPVTAHLFAGRAPWVAHAPMLAALLAVALVANVSAVRRLTALMRSLSDRSPSPNSASVGDLAQTLGRHQLGSVASTVVDFGALTALVELAHLHPVAATAAGAFAGAVTNFTLARRWIFRDHANGPVGAQALRYVVVSGASLLLNMLGEYVFATRLGLQYVLARALVAVAVSLLWNFPMQRRFVFPRAAAEARVSDKATRDPLPTSVTRAIFDRVAGAGLWKR